MISVGIMLKGKSIKYSILILASFLLIGLTVSGCSSPKSNIVKSNLSGKWQEIGNTEIIELFNDNRFSIMNNGQTYLGSWIILDDGRFKFVITAGGSTHIYLGKIEGDVLAITMPDGSVGKYQKIAA
jgi:hypothetical protein